MGVWREPDPMQPWFLAVITGLAGEADCCKGGRSRKKFSYHLLGWKLHLQAEPSRQLLIGTSGHQPWNAGYGTLSDDDIAYSMRIVEDSRSAMARSIQCMPPIRGKLLGPHHL